MRLPDPHTYGSGNPGATNVLRTGNKLAAVLTLIGDALKGYIAVMLARVLLGDESLTSTMGSWVLSCVVIAVFLGHLFPIFHGFKGGKGVATACGILFGINWILGAATLSTWIIVAPMGLALLVVCSLLIWRHRSNIQNLMNGTESRIGSKKKTLASGDKSTS
jgi:glycerol-3-phosphate acyltransferase PlsY